MKLSAALNSEWKSSKRSPDKHKTNKQIYKCSKEHLIRVVKLNCLPHNGKNLHWLLRKRWVTLVLIQISCTQGQGKWMANYFHTVIQFQVWQENHLASLTNKAAPAVGVVKNTLFWGFPQSKNSFFNDAFSTLWVFWPNMRNRYPSCHGVDTLPSFQH